MNPHFIADLLAEIEYPIGWLLVWACRVTSLDSTDNYQSSPEQEAS
jgi:hypothetical protein